MNNKNILPQFGLSTKESNTSSSSLISSDKNNIESADRFVHLKETKTHLFCLIPSDNENNNNSSREPQLIRIKISKRRPQSKHPRKTKVLDCSNLPGNIRNLELMVSSNRTRIKNDLKMSSLNQPSNRKKTEHPSFVVLPENKTHVKISENQSTSDNSNETYIIRSKKENKLLPNRASQTSFRRDLVCPISKSKFRMTGESSSSGPISTEIKSEDYCECAKYDERRHRTSKNDNIALSKEPLPIQAINRNPEEFFQIKFIESTPLDASSRLKAGQDHEDKNYKIPRYTCPKINRIFPPSGAGTRREYNYSGRTSNGCSNRNNNEIVKINYNLVRQCLKHSSADEKCEVLDALRVRIKSKTLNAAASTIEDIQKFDLFGVQCECRSRPILEDLFWPLTERIPHPLQTSIARLINAMVSYETGRDYFNNRSIIHLLTWGDLGRDNIDEEMADNLMAVMMKLSKNRFHCTDMIKKGLLKWLLNHMELAEYSSSKYHLECMTGLLRMLMSIENSIDLSMTEIRDWIVMLGRYLDSENTNIRRNILASLLALFQRNGAIAGANEMNFSQIINKHIEMSSNSNEKKHLKILNQLLTGKSNSTKTRKSAIPSAEEELDFDDKTESGGSEIDNHPGEKLLREKFCFNKDEQSSSRSKKKHFSFETKKPTCNPPNDDNLASRVFIEHLHCQLPKINENRIFPMFNHRTVDTPQTCVHINDTAPLRSPYLSGTTRTLKFHERLSRQGKQVTNTNEHSRGNTVVKQLPKKFKEELTGEQHIQQLPAEASSTLQDLKGHLRLSSETTTKYERTVKNEFTLSPMESQELYVGEANMLTDVSVHKSDQQLSAGATETIEDKLAVESTKYQETNMLKDGTRNVDQQLAAENEESTKSAKLQELSHREPKSLDDSVPKSYRQLLVRASEIFQDELTADPAKDQESTFGEPEAASLSEVDLGPISDQQLSAELSECQEESTAIPIEVQLYVTDPKTLNDEIPQSQNQLSEKASEKLNVELSVDVELAKYQELSTGETDTLEDKVSENDQQLSAETGDKLKNASTAEHVNQELPATESKVQKDHVVGRPKSAEELNTLEERELSAVEPHTLEDYVLESDQNLSVGAKEPSKDESETFNCKSAKSDLNVDIEKLTFGKTSIDSTIDQQLADEQIGAPNDQQFGASSNSKDEKISPMENYQQLLTKSVDKLGRCAVTRQASDKCVASVRMSKSKKKSVTTVKSDQQLSADSVEILKDEANDNRGSGYPTLVAKHKSKEITSMKSDQTLQITSTYNVLERHELTIEELKDDAIEKPEDVLKVNEINKVASAQHLPANERTKRELGGVKSVQQLIAAYVEMSEDETIDKRANDHPSTETDAAALTIDLKLKKETIAERVSDNSLPSTTISKSKEMESDEQLPMMSVEMLTFKVIARRATAQTMEKSKSDQQMRRKNVVQPTRSEPPPIIHPPIESVKIDENLKEESKARQKSDGQVRMEQQNSKEEAIIRHSSAVSSPEKEFFRQTSTEQSADEVKGSTERIVASLEIDQNLEIEVTEMPTSDNPLSSGTIVKSEDVKSDHQLPVEILKHQISDPITVLSIAGVKSDQQNDDNDNPSPSTTIGTSKEECVKSDEQLPVTSEEILKDEATDKWASCNRATSLTMVKSKEIETIKSDQHLPLTVVVKKTKNETDARANVHPLPSVSNKNSKEYCQDQKILSRSVEILGSKASEHVVEVNSTTKSNIEKIGSQISGRQFSSLSPHFEDQVISTTEANRQSSSISAEKTEDQAVTKLKSDSIVRPNDQVGQQLSSSSRNSEEAIATLEPDKLEDGILESNQHVSVGVNETFKDDLKLYTDEPRTFKRKIPKSDQQISPGAADTLTDKIPSAPEKYEAFSDEKPKMLKDEVGAGLKSDEAETMVELEYKLMEWEAIPAVAELAEFEAVPIVAAFSDKSYENLKKETLTSSKSDQQSLFKSLEPFKGISVTTAISATQLFTTPMDMLNDEVIVRPTVDEGFVEIKKSQEEVVSSKSHQQLSSLEMLDGAAIVGRTSEHLAQVEAIRKSKEKLELSEKSDQQIYDKDIEQTSTHDDTFSCLIPIQLPRKEIINRNVGVQEMAAIRLSKELQARHLQSDEKLTVEFVEPVDGATYTPEVEATKLTEVRIKSEEQLNDTILRIKRQQLEVYARELNEEVIAKLKIDQKLKEETISTRDSHEQVNAPTEVSQSQHLFDKSEIKGQPGKILKYIHRLAPRSTEVGQFNEIKKVASDHHLAANARGNQEANLSVKSAQQLKPRSMELINEKTIENLANQHRSDTLKSHRRLAPRSMEVRQFNEIKKGSSNHHLAANSKGNQEAISSATHQLQPRSVEVMNEETINKSTNEHRTLKCHRRLAPRSVKVGQVNEIKKWTSDQHLAADETSKEKAVAGAKIAEQLRETSIEILKEEKSIKLSSDHRSTEIDVVSTKHWGTDAMELEMVTTNVKGREEIVTSNIDQELKEATRQRINQQCGATSLSKVEYVASMEIDADLLPRDAAILKNKSISSDHSSLALSKSQEWKVSAVKNDQKLSSRSAIVKPSERVVEVSSMAKSNDMKNASEKISQHLSSSSRNSENVIAKTSADQNISITSAQKMEGVANVDEFTDHEIAGVISSVEEIVEESDLNVDIEKLSFGKSIHDDITESSICLIIGQLLKDAKENAEPSDQQVGALGNSKDETVAVMENDQQLLAEPMAKLEGEAVIRRDDSVADHIRSQQLEIYAVELKEEVLPSNTIDEYLKEEFIVSSETSIDSTIDQQLDDEQIGGTNDEQFGASSKLKDGKIAPMEKYQQLSAKSVDKLGHCAVTRRASDRMSKLKEKTVTTVKSDQQLSAEPVETIKGGANDNWGSGYPTLVAKRKSKEVASMKSDQTLQMTSTDNVLDRQEAISIVQELSGIIEELKDKAFDKSTSEHLVLSEDVLKVNEIKKVASAQHLPANERTKQELGGVKSVQQLIATYVEMSEDETIDKRANDHPSTETISERVSDNSLLSTTITKSKEMESDEQLPMMSVEMLTFKAIARRATAQTMEKSKSDQQMRRKNVVKPTRSEPPIIHPPIESVKIDENLKEESKARQTSDEQVRMEQQNSKGQAITRHASALSSPEKEFFRQTSSEQLAGEVKGSTEKIVASLEIDQNLEIEVTEMPTSDNPLSSGTIVKSEDVKSDQQLPVEILKHQISDPTTVLSIAVVRNDQQNDVRPTSTQESVMDNPSPSTSIGTSKEIECVTSDEQLPLTVVVNKTKNETDARASVHPLPSVANKNSKEETVTTDQKILSRPGEILGSKASDHVVEVNSTTKSNIEKIGSQISGRQLSYLSLHLEDQAISTAEANCQSSSISAEKSKHEAVTNVKSDQNYNDFKNYAITEVISSVEEIIQEQILSVDMATAESTFDRSLSDITAAGSEQVSTERSRTKTVDSSIWREMLHNDELIDRLCEKVLKKLRARRFCGSSCGSPCGGLNLNFNPNKIESKEKSPNFE